MFHVDTLKDYQVTISIAQEVRSYDVRSVSKKVCETDFRRVFGPYGLTNIEVRKVPQKEFIGLEQS